MNPNALYLVQTDTTVGFVSQDAQRLNTTKQRPAHKQLLKVVSNFNELKKFTRIPQNHKKRVRRSTKTTFIYNPTLAVRVVSGDHKKFIDKIGGWAFSTSANRSGEDFDEAFAKEKADIIIHTKLGFSQKESSSIIRLSKNRLKIVR
jgi:tRNA A37 threonylcarbamoyladenosine synthetase subunit TsaC/SUA5/YrdC